MENDTQILTTYATYKQLYKNKDTDVYDIISEFIRHIILTEHKLSYSQIELSDLLNKYFDFQIPTLVLKPAALRINGVSLSEKQFRIDYNKVTEHNEFNTLHKTVLTSTTTLLNKLVKYIEEKTNSTYTYNDVLQIHDAFKTFILDKSSTGKYHEFISSFIIENSDNHDFTKKLNHIREGHILYSGLSLNKNIIAHGWNTKLTIYLDTEILFHIAGYNGETFQKIANEFLNLVKDANSSKQLITLKYFPETAKDINSFFYKAENILETNTIIRPGQTAMESILHDCKEPIDVTNKKTSFFYMLNRKHIYEETKNDFYDHKYDFANLEYLTTDSEEEQNIKVLSHINKLRKNNIFTDYAECVAIFISETGSVLELSNKFNTEKISNLGSNVSSSSVPLAINLYTITNTLWYRLNKSLHSTETPSTIDAVTRAQIVLSKFVNNSISEEYDQILEQQQQSPMEKDELASLIVGMRQRSSKPENLIQTSVNNALNFICEKDIDKYNDDYKIALQKLSDEKKNRQISDAKYAFDMENLKLTHLISNRENIQKEFDRQVKLSKINIKKRKFILLFLGIIYYLIIVISIYKLGWDKMEPITYILGIPPILYSFICSVMDFKWNIKIWINKYSSSSNYITAQENLKTITLKIQEQEKIKEAKENEYKNLSS